MAGPYPNKSPEKVNGFIHLRATEQPSDLNEWRKQSEALFQHLRRLMSFGLAHHVKAPIRELRTSTDWECTFTSQSTPRKNNHPVFHSMALQPFFDSAVSSFFDSSLKHKKISYAIEWFSMDAEYVESRLTNAITSLENLTASNLQPADKNILPKSIFKKIRPPLRKFIFCQLAKMVESSTLQASQAREFFENASKRLAGLNNTSLRRRVFRLSEKWGVPLGDLSMDELGRANIARNWIVHRGYYYPESPGAPKMQDLFDHVLLVREIVTRFVLTAIRYKGKYISFRGGQHDVDFPPNVSDSS